MNVYRRVLELDVIIFIAEDILRVELNEVLLFLQRTV